MQTQTNVGIMSQCFVVFGTSKKLENTASLGTQVTEENCRNCLTCFSSRESLKKRPGPVLCFPDELCELRFFKDGTFCVFSGFFCSSFEKRSSTESAALVVR